MSTAEELSRQYVESAESKSIGTHESDHTALVHVLWGIAHSEVDLHAEADSVARTIRRSRYSQAKKVHDQIEILEVVKKTVSCSPDGINRLINLLREGSFNSTV